MKKSLALLLALLMLLLTGCNTPAYHAEALTSQVSPAPADADLKGPGALATTNFGVRLLQAADEGDNLLISPVSVLTALGMTVNGAAGDTRRQMEDVLGLPTEELNGYLRTYAASLPRSQDAKCELANSVWFRDDADRLTVEQSFLDTAAAYYGAESFKAPFDSGTAEDINGWVSDHTDGLIPTILDKIPADAMLYLINALAFDAAWEEPYEEFQIHDGVFTAEDGSKQDAEFLYSAEGSYLEDDLATGFLKPYKGGDYAFAALLPGEGVTLDELLASLTGEALRQTLTTAQNEEVYVSIPKFTAQTSLELSDALKALGMTDAFDPGRADLSAMGSSTGGPLAISRILHKTYLALDEHGTKAAAVTVVEPAEGCEPEPPKVVHLDRPFLYLLVDTQTMTPLFLGAVRHL